MFVSKNNHNNPSMLYSFAIIAHKTIIVKVFIYIHYKNLKENRRSTPPTLQIILILYQLFLPNLVLLPE